MEALHCTNGKLYNYLLRKAVSCYRCDYLYKAIEEQFLLAGGDEEWLRRGLEAVPGKLALISSLNVIMAF
jgi:hypothetical protein